MPKSLSGSIASKSPERQDVIREDAQHMINEEMGRQIPVDLLMDALEFYECGADGQYDEDVVVPLIKAEISRRKSV